MRRLNRKHIFSFYSGPIWPAYGEKKKPFFFLFSKNADAILVHLSCHIAAFMFSMHVHFVQSSDESKSRCSEPFTKAEHEEVVVAIAAAAAASIRMKTKKNENNNRFEQNKKPEDNAQSEKPNHMQSHTTANERTNEHQTEYKEMDREGERVRKRSQS